ncbi:unnamed protein product [Mycena citricolor]|uniref:DUF6533 domain-containing protein n=1 Tax=Mycena citricolor TaxID=2018698 RepID=A0AAD2HHP7_9AGAR|nr:unnamed protein product [Mycena citricolor]
MSSADALGAEQALLLQLLKDSTLTNELAVAALSIVVVEHIATLRDEIDLVWRTRISLANVFYIWIRYFTLGVICFSVYNLVRPQDSDRVCQNFFYVLLSTCTLIVVSADFILALRVWILFHRSRTLLYFLVPLLMAELTGMLVTGYFAIVDLKVYVHAPGLTGCYSQDVPRLLTYYAVPPFLMATTMFAMTLHRCRLSLVTSRAFGRGPIIAMFLRDGVFWFLGVVLLATAEIVIWHTARPTLAQLPILPATSLIAMIGARVVLNIKQIAANRGSGIEPRALSSFPVVTPSIAIRAYTTSHVYYEEEEVYARQDVEM